MPDDPSAVRIKITIILVAGIYAVKRGAERKIESLPINGKCKKIKK